MTDVTCRLTAKNRDQLRNPTLGKSYTDTDTDFFAAKRTRTDPTEFRRKKVRVRVGPVSVSV